MDLKLSKLTPHFPQIITCHVKQFVMAIKFNRDGVKMVVPEENNHVALVSILEFSQYLRHKPINAQWQDK